MSHQKLEITKDTRVSEIFEAYGDIADVMEVSGMIVIGILLFLASLQALKIDGKAQGKK